MIDDDPTFVPVPPPDNGPTPAEVAAPVDRSQPRPQDAPQPSSRSWVLAAVILVVIALTAAWQLLGVWTMVGVLFGVLVIIGAVSKWRQGARPDLPGFGLPSWRAFKPAGGIPPPSSKARPAKTPPVKTPKAPKAPGGGGRAPRWPRAKIPAPASTPRAPRPPKQTPSSRHTKREKSAARKALTWRKAVRRWRGIGFWVASPVALPLAGLIQVANWALRRFPLSEGEVAQPDEPEQETPTDQEETAPEAPVPIPGPAVERPEAQPTTSTRTTSTGASMSSPVVHAAAEAIREHIGGFVGQNATDFTSFVGGLDELFDATWEALGSANGRFSDDDPISPAVVEHLEQIRAMVSALAEYARDGAAVFQAAHEADLERLDNPRPNEDKMDYSQQ